MPLELYSDVNQFEPTNQSLLYNDDSVYQALYNLMSTSPGERHFNPEYGVDLDQFVFEYIDGITEEQMFNHVENKVDLFEPRAYLSYTESSIERDVSNGILNVSFIFIIKDQSKSRIQITGVVNT